jgi:hypothetical protein
MEKAPTIEGIVGPVVPPLTEMDNAVTILSVAAGSFLIYAHASMASAIGAACNRALSSPLPDFAVTVPNAGDHVSAAAGTVLAGVVYALGSRVPAMRPLIAMLGLVAAMFSVAPLGEGGGSQARVFVFMLLVAQLAVMATAMIRWVRRRRRPNAAVARPDPMALVKQAARWSVLGAFTTGLGAAVFCSWLLHPPPTRAWIEPYGEVIILRADDKGYLVEGLSEHSPALQEVLKEAHLRTVDWIAAGSVTCITETERKKTPVSKANSK